MRRIIVFVSLPVIIIMLIILALFLAAFVMTGKRQNLEEALAWQSARYDTSFYETIETIKSCPKDCIIELGT